MSDRGGLSPDNADTAGAAGAAGAEGAEGVGGPRTRRMLPPSPSPALARRRARKDYGPAAP